MANTITKTVEVTVDIDIARIILRIAGFKVNNMTDDEIFEQAVKMNEEYAVKSSIINSPDMRTKITDYISDLDTEIDRCTTLVENKMETLMDSNLIESYTTGVDYINMESRLHTLVEVKNDLQGRLEELI